MMESIEKLRYYAKTICCIDGDNINRFADEIEREIADRYMELPVDADGVPIHVGDKMNRVDGGPGHRAGAVCREGFNDAPIWCANDFCHVKPRTIEDVLRDCCNEWNEHLGDDWEQGVYAKYADELRSMGVDE